jgi:hypothetical protein
VAIGGGNGMEAGQADREVKETVAEQGSVAPAICKQRYQSEITPSRDGLGKGKERIQRLVP